MAKHMDQEASSPSAPKATVIIVNQKQGPARVLHGIEAMLEG